MEVTSSGLYIFTDIHSRVPAETRRFPDNKLRQNLSRTGMKPNQILNIQQELAVESIRLTDVTADLITTPRQGMLLHNIYEDDDPQWSGYGLTYPEGAIASAIQRAVGTGWHVGGRFFLDALVMDGRRIAVISGRGMDLEGQWYLVDESEWKTDMKTLVRDLEKRGRYAAIIADVKKPTGNAARYTESTPFLYTAGKKGRREVYFP